MKYNTTLRCPKCSGYRYGSAIGTDGKILHRTCNGHVFQLRPGGTIEVQSCFFQWPPEDDYKYFVVQGTFESAEEHDRQLKFIDTEHVIDALIEDMRDRKGFRQLWDEIVRDTEVMEEIRKVWRSIIRWNIIPK